MGGGAGECVSGGECEVVGWAGRWKEERGIGIVSMVCPTAASRSASQAGAVHQAGDERVWAGKRDDAAPETGAGGRRARAGDGDHSQRNRGSAGEIVIHRRGAETQRRI